MSPERLLATALAALTLAVAVARSEPEPPEPREAIARMKSSPRGPFEAIRWFCRDGAVLPPAPGACRQHGGGVQHGQWSEATRRLRASGYHVGNVLAGLDPAAFLGRDADLDPLVDLLLERFLMQADDGWIFRGARTYRGAFQVEDEEAAARSLLLALVTDPTWLAPQRFLLLREVARLLPTAGIGATEVRQLAGELAEADPSFASLRNKIHGLPDRGDAARVREHATRSGRRDLASRYAALAGGLDALYDQRRNAEALRVLAREAQGRSLRDALTGASEEFVRERSTAEERLRAAAAALARLRDELPGYPPQDRVRALHASLLLETVAYTAGSALRAPRAGSSRRDRLELVPPLVESLYGVGLISARQREALREAMVRVGEAPLPLGAYRRELGQLGRAADWSAQALAFHVSPRVERLARLDPLVTEYLPDRLRGSPLLAWNSLLDELQLDASALAHSQHVFFGEAVGSGLRALNPGLARGVLRIPAETEPVAGFSRSGIYLLPHTQSELPPVAGILTRGEGSSLSHVQLLARNLGIPNVAVGGPLLERLMGHDGEAVVLAVSPLGRVELARDGPRWEAVFGTAAPADDLRIQPDLGKLDLSTWRSAPLSSLRVTDSGRRVGPKAANLGELRHHYGDAVSRGVVVPFGAFRRLLEQPIRPGGPSVFEWMVERYAEIAELEGHPDRQQRAIVEFLGELRAWIEGADPGAEFRADLAATLEATLGPDGSYGVFVRSDTNVEDLPGFTGAGLNLTVPNVVGFDAILAALARVWASPFSERAYAWRQAHMDQPQYVFPAVLLLESVPSEKSGVLVSVDVDSGDPRWLSIAASEGVGGAVEGQAAEELRVRRSDGRVRLLSQATAPRKAVLEPDGGMAMRPASGSDSVLDPAEIEQLRSLVAGLPERFPAFGPEAGGLHADIEFGFRDGRLALFQIRPFVESRRARRSQYLQQLDRAFERSASSLVDLDAPSLRPTGSAP